MKILVKFPSRERPDRFFASLDSIYNNVHRGDLLYVLVTIDTNDATMNNEDVINRMGQYKNLQVIAGDSTSKIHAINRDMELIPELFPEAADWDIVVVMADDQQFCVPDFDEYIRGEMQVAFPDTDGYLHFWEKDSHTALNVMTIKGRKYYERFGFLYDPRFKSLWVDNLQMEIAKMLGKYRFVHFEIFRHFNPAYGYEGYEKDDLFIEQQEIGYTVDQELFFQLKSKNFEIERWLR